MLVCNKLSFGEIQMWDAIMVYRQLWKQSECITDALSRIVSGERDCVIRSAMVAALAAVQLQLLLKMHVIFIGSDQFTRARHIHGDNTAKWAKKIDTIWYVLCESKIDFLEQQQQQ